ncbi:MAG: response regulator transcription factor [Leptolyngbya sp. SIO3F4]|nr:response regulator transcription factor [Leptolyngbya sp. SIO3F4]
MTHTPIRVVLTDDHKLFREGIRFVLEQTPDIDLEAEASNHDELMHILENNLPDIVLLDLEMQPIDGMQTLKDLKARYPEVKVIILTMHGDPKIMAYLMELGANAYLLKDSDSEELKHAIRMVYREGFYFNNQLAKAMLGGLRNKKTKTQLPNSPESISAREKEVLELICQGYTAKQIAEKLFISQRTAEGHRKNLIAKMGVTNTATLIVKAIKEHVIEP